MAEDEWDYPDHPDYPHYKPDDVPDSLIFNIWCGFLLLLRVAAVCFIIYIIVALSVFLVRGLLGLPPMGFPLPNR